MKVLSQVEAGQRLARGVAQVLKDTPIIIAITPGGAAVGAEMADVLAAPLDVLTVVRLEVPGRMHSTFGAVADGTVVLIPDQVRELGLPADYVDALAALARNDANRITQVRRGMELPVPLDHQTVVLVDDGSADATLAVSASTALRRAGVGRLIFAAPQAGAELARGLQGLADELVLLEESGRSTQVRDPSFSHTTEFDVHALVCRNRKSTASLAVPAKAI
jgi:putative phosphoribosyl transferase